MTGPPPNDAILHQLGRILASPQLIEAAKLGALLRFIVERALAGEADALKERWIAVQVFHRQPDYDSGKNTIVRTSASNLRKRLKSYYETVDDPIVIALPHGYVPTFDWRNPPKPAPAEPLRSRVSLGLLVAAIFIVGLVGASWMRSREVGLQVSTVYRRVSDSSFAGGPAISRDGRLLAFASDRAGGELEIWVRPLRSPGEAVRVTDAPERDTDPDFSPDGAQIVFRSWRGGGIWIVPTTGGAARQLVAGGYSPRFAPNGRWVSFVANGIYIVPSGGGDPVVSTVGSTTRAVRFGRRIAPTCSMSQKVTTVAMTGGCPASKLSATIHHHHRGAWAIIRWQHNTARCFRIGKYPGRAIG